MGLPDGPSTLEELYQWPRYNAQQLLVDSEHASRYRNNFEALMKYDIHIHDCYSGTGTGSSTLHLQHAHMIRATLSLYTFEVTIRKLCISLKIHLIMNLNSEPALFKFPISKSPNIRCNPEDVTGRSGSHRVCAVYHRF